MIEEGYKVLCQTEEKTYGATMADQEEKLESQTQDTTGNGQVPVRPVRRSKAEIHGLWKQTSKALLLKNQLQSQPSETIANLTLYTLNRSDGDLEWKWKSVGNLISECNDPARPPVKGLNQKYAHWKLRRTVEHIYFRIFTFLLIFLDIAFVIVELVKDCAGDEVSTIIRNLEVCLSVYFLIEVFMRVVALTPKVFFSKKSWHNVVDFIVVLLAFGATVAAVVIIGNIEAKNKVTPSGELWNLKEGGPWCEKDEEGESSREDSRYISLIGALRIIRIFRFVRLLRLYFEHHNVVKGVRQRVCENKRRFQADGYDLDLTYVTTHIIAMSFPSKGTKAVYRNKIDEVAKFFEDKHSDDKNIDYMVYNLCSEMEYDHRKFHGNVRRYQIDDHNVPELEKMIELVDDVQAWLQGAPEDRSRVVALHCKGGKGRTGTMICAVLINQNLFEDAGDTLEYFGQRRTDLNVASKFQGVETYSQIRYVHYFQEVHRRGLKVIPSRPMRIMSINITGLRGVGAGDGSDFTVSVLSRGKQVFICTFRANAPECKVKHDKKVDRLEVLLTNPPVIDKDTKFLFTCSTKGVPKGYDDCAFFFWLNTFFIKGDRELMLREELDNPHKEKTWRVWRENFSVEVVFQSAENEASKL